MATCPTTPQACPRLAALFSSWSIRVSGHAQYSETHMVFQEEFPSDAASVTPEYTFYCCRNNSTSGMCIACYRGSVLVVLGPAER
jgi:hypothetical protein